MSRHGNDVATWPRLLGHLVSRPELVQCTVLCTVQVTVWTLFMNTVHEHCSKGKKKKKEYKKI